MARHVDQERCEVWRKRIEAQQQGGRERGGALSTGRDVNRQLLCMEAEAAQAAFPASESEGFNLIVGVSLRETLFHLAPAR